MKKGDFVELAVECNGSTNYGPCFFIGPNYTIFYPRKKYVVADDVRIINKIEYILLEGDLAEILYVPAYLFKPFVERINISAYRFN